jgi:uncharacterized membrane protein YhaH (DUF805 family)
MSLLNLLFSYKGRIGRLVFWFGIIFPVAIAGTTFHLAKGYYVLNNVMIILGTATLIWIITAGLCKRLHDLNYSGWCQLLFFVPLITIYIFYLNYNMQPWVITLGFITYFIGLWILLWTAIISGIPEPNRFTHSPTSLSKSQNRWEPSFKNILKGKDNNKQKNKKNADDSFALFNQAHRITPTITANNKNVIQDDPENWVDDGQPEILRSTASIFTTKNTE